jgi:hypothetical protein
MNLSDLPSVDALATTVVVLGLRAAQGDVSARHLLRSSQRSAELLSIDPTDPGRPTVVSAVTDLARRLIEAEHLRVAAEALHLSLESGDEWAELRREVGLDCGLLEFG